jgi:tetratricopeptide (TPR) repeat protein
MTTFAFAFVVFLAISMAGFLAGGGARRGRLLWLAVPLGVSLCAAALYAWQGAAKPAQRATAAFATPPGMPKEAAEPFTPLAPDAHPGPDAPAHDAGDMGGMAAKLAARLEHDPDDGPGWALLARAYAWMGRYAEADAAFAKAARLKVDDPKLQADWDAARAKAKAGAAGGGFVAGTVTIAEPLRHTLHASDTVFVFARAPGGGPPLAAKRFKASELPLQFRLDDADAMVPGRNLSSAPEVEVLARLSASGSATRQPGDIEAPPQSVRPGSSGVVLEIGAPRD